MYLRIPFFLLICIFCAVPLFAAQELSVLPYAVETISSDFPPESGDDYAKLIGIGAMIDKDISVYTYHEMKKDIARQGLNPAGTVTKEDLALFCKSRYLAYAVTGRISKTSQGYASSSVLFSSQRNAVVSIAKVSARSLPELAAKETRELFLQFTDKDQKEMKGQADIVFILDTSYAMSREWPSVAKGIELLAGECFDAWPGTAVHIIPFAESFALNGLPDVMETVPAVHARLASFKLKGGSKGKAMVGALSFALENISWRKDASRSAVIITNAPLGDASAESLALRAKKKSIGISVMVMGNVDERDSSLYGRIAQISRGKMLYGAYRQKQFDNRGNEYFLFMERGRLFEGDTGDASWRDGLFRSPGNGTGYLQGPSFAEEVVLKKTGFAVTPYTMSKYYAKSGNRSVLNSSPLENNCSDLISSLSDEIVKMGEGSVRGKTAARVLLSQGNVSLWVSVSDEKDLVFFEEHKELGFVFPLGVRLSPRSDEPLGFTFNPDRYYTGFNWDDLPDSIRVSLSDMAKNPGRYASQGMFTPPVWFVNVKVDQVDRKRSGGDIRDRLQP